MSLNNNRLRWGSISQLFHWAIAITIIATAALGLYMVDVPLSQFRLKIQLYDLHKAIGIILILVVVARLAWRWINPTPALPDNLKGYERVLAKGTHWLFYGLMFAMPISGYIMHSTSTVRRTPVELFGGITVPNILPANENLSEIAEGVHEALFWVLAVLLVLHVAAALKHHFILKDGVLLRMLPFTQSAQRRREQALGAHYSEGR
ncbi:MAG: cytochrome b [Candidatus Competibacterales bacterium]